jgi:hypothetical protein
MTDKRMLKQQYLDTTVRAGVYVIRNVISGRALVAGSTNAQGTLNRHQFELRQGMHRNALLRDDWLRHGEASFEFELLDMVKPGDDPGFDIQRELDDLVAMWRQEIACTGEQAY